MNKTLQFFLHPKRYINKRIEERVNNILTSNKYIPINETKPEDIFIIGFPKSGHSWMQNLISSILFCPDARYLPNKIVVEMIPDVYDKTYYKRFWDVCFFKSHELPQQHHKRVIYLVRDGRDAMVSYYHYNINIGIDLSLGEMVMEGKYVTPCKWHEHINAWLQNPYNAEMIIIKYEDLLNDPLCQIKLICDFSNIERNENDLKKIIETNSFTVSQVREELFGHDNIYWQGNAKDKRFYRKGKSGSYKKEMSKDLQEYFINEAGNILSLFNYLGQD